MKYSSPDAARAAAMTPPAAQAQSEPEIGLKEYITNIAGAGPEAIKLLSTRLAKTPYYIGKPSDSEPLGYQHKPVFVNVHDLLRSLPVYALPVM